MLKNETSHHVCHPEARGTSALGLLLILKRLSCWRMKHHITFPVCCSRKFQYYNYAQISSHLFVIPLGILRKLSVDSWQFWATWWRKVVSGQGFNGQCALESRRKLSVDSFVQRWWAIYWKRDVDRRRLGTSPSLVMLTKETSHNCSSWLLTESSVRYLRVNIFTFICHFLGNLIVS